MKTAFQVHHVQTHVFGRYVVQTPVEDGPFPLFVGFHGYGEDAETHLMMMQQIPGIHHWLCCAVQALHPFYPRPGKHGASWLTSQDRALRIQENVRYVDGVIAQLKQAFPVNAALVLHGFSQGAAMACRAALLGEHPPCGVLLLGGDIPPELGDLERMQRVFIARGHQDRLYSLEQWNHDVFRLKQAQLNPVLCTFHGGHGGSGEYFHAAGEFLTHCRDISSQKETRQTRSMDV